MLDIVFLLFVVGVLYYVYLLINPSTHRWALDNVLYVAVVSFVGYQLVSYSIKRENQNRSKLDKLLSGPFSSEGGRRRR